MLPDFAVGDAAGQGSRARCGCSQTSHSRHAASPARGGEAIAEPTPLAHTVPGPLAGGAVAAPCRPPRKAMGASPSASRERRHTRPDGDSRRTFVESRLPRARRLPRIDQRPPPVRSRRCSPAQISAIEQSPWHTSTVTSSASSPPSAPCASASCWPDRSGSEATTLNTARTKSSSSGNPSPDTGKVGRRRFARLLPRKRRIA